jgi:hypothetical protein
LRPRTPTTTIACAIRSTSMDTGRDTAIDAGG